VAKALEVLASVLQNDAAGQEVVQQEIIPALQRLQEDSDADVRYVDATSRGVNQCASMLMLHQSMTASIDTLPPELWSERKAAVTP
jgi:hypothetical protein